MTGCAKSSASVLHNDLMPISPIQAQAATRLREVRDMICGYISRSDRCPAGRLIGEC